MLIKNLFTLCTLLSSATLLAQSSAATKQEEEAKKSTSNCNQVSIAIQSPLRQAIDQALPDSGMPSPLKNLIEQYAEELPQPFWQRMRSHVWSTGKTIYSSLHTQNPKTALFRGIIIGGATVLVITRLLQSSQTPQTYMVPQWTERADEYCDEARMYAYQCADFVDQLVGKTVCAIFKPGPE